MKRALVLGGLLSTAALTVTLAALQQAPPAPMVIEVDKLKDNLYVLKGGGGNTALFITATGAVVVDTKLPGWGQPLLEKIKTLTNKPVTTIINTHTHFDHVSGNVDFPATVEVIAHENTKTYMDEANPVYGLQTGPQANIFKEHGGQGMPKRTFKDKMTIGAGADRIDLYYFGRAHTSGDAFVIFPALRVMHTGDTFPNKGMPIMDINNGGSGLAYADTLEKAAKVQNIDIVITGHNQTTLTSADIQTYAEFVRDFVATVRAAKKAGQSIDDVANSWKMPERFVKQGFAANTPVNRVKPNVEVLWKELN